MDLRGGFWGEGEGVGSVDFGVGVVCCREGLQGGQDCVFEALGL